MSWPINKGRSDVEMLMPYIEIEYIMNGKKMYIRFLNNPEDIENSLNFIRGLLRHQLKFTVTYL